MSHSDMLHPVTTTDIGEVHYFGTDLKDSKGREFGAIYHLYTETVTEGPVLPWSEAHARGLHASSVTIRSPGVYYVADVRATRDGKSYGASHPKRYFDDPSARELYVKQRLAAIQKRAAKG